MVIGVSGDLKGIVSPVTYCRANQEWQWHNIVFTLNINLYTSLELTRIDRSLVY